MRAVDGQSEGAVKLLPGTLYNLLKRMLEDSWIEELDERPTRLWTMSAGVITA